MFEKIKPGVVSGRLTVISQATKKEKRMSNQKWICQCECGNVTEVRNSNLYYGTTRSCGCLKRECKEKEYWGKVVRHFGPVAPYGLKQN